jgi:hypothetical protein
LTLRSTFFLRVQGSYRREDLLSHPAQNPLDYQALVSVVLREVTIPPRSCAPASVFVLPFVSIDLTTVDPPSECLKHYYFIGNVIAL